MTQARNSHFGTVNEDGAGWSVSEKIVLFLPAVSLSGMPATFSTRETWQRRAHCCQVIQ